MAKTNPTGKKKHGFLIFTVVYAVVFLAAAAVGLRYFWNFIDAYEQSRPMNTVKAYVAELSYDGIADEVQPLIAQVDPNLQSPDACAEVIRQAMSEPITYSKLASASSDTQQVFVLRSGRDVIGKMTISASEPDQYGFSRWTVTDEEFDFSYLLGDAVTVTVPDDYQIIVNGGSLDESYIVESGIPFELLEDYYDRFTSLPRLVTYEIGAGLGEISFTVADAAGNPVELVTDGEYDRYLADCSDDMKAQLDVFIPAFLESYVAYTGSSENSVYGNYANVSAYLVPGSPLQTRLLGALNGLIWAQSMGDTITDITVHHYLKLDNSHYLCDLTYLVDTTGSKGVVETVNNVRIIVTVTNNGLKAEALTIY